MDIQNIYINDDIIHNIFDNLDFHDKISFSQSNNYMYINYYDKIKYYIYLYLHKNYKLYKECINRFKYDKSQIKMLGMIALSDPNTVKSLTIHNNYITYYDLRYIFELIMKDLDINDPDIVNANESINMRFILNKIKKCKSFNRFETKNKINNESSLISLHTLFSPYIHNNTHNIHNNTHNNTHDIQWEPL